MRYAFVLILLAAAAPTLAAAETAVVRASDCRYLVRHEPAPDVAYAPGRDVRGGAVAPADLPGSAALSLPREIDVALTIPLSAFLGATTPPRLDAAEVDAGTVTVDREGGRILYNGAPLTDPETDRLIAACREALPPR